MSDETGVPGRPGAGEGPRRRLLEDRPVLSGIVALLSVGLVIGLVFGGGALAATRLLGIGGGGGGAGTGGDVARETAVIPDPVETDGDAGPRLTLGPDTQAPTDELPEGIAPDDDEDDEDDDEDEEEGDFVLNAPPSSVAANEQIDLVGTYPDGPGTTLQVERFEGGAWSAFPVTVSVGEDGAFSTFIRTTRTGDFQFRLTDPSGVSSNPVDVTIS